MKVRNLHFRQERFDVDSIGLSIPEQIAVNSFDSLVDETKSIVEVWWRGGEVRVGGDNRGEAMLLMAELFGEISKRLKKMAFEQEGAIRLK